MASDQVEYCGECKHYARCKKLAEQGKLEKCKAVQPKKPRRL